jgi:hypothetical protein
MSHGHTRIDSKGICIYCGRSGLVLTDEHVVPLSLGGQHIINEASCLDCADITKKFEQDVARELWGDARISYDAPSRRKKRRATHVILPDPQNPQRRIKVPYSEYPAPLVFYKMHKAGLLQGVPALLDISGAWQFVTVSDHQKNLDFEKKFGMPLTAKFRHVPASFARLLAKTAYCNALCSLDPGDFRPICVPYILGRDDNLSYIVGSSFNIPEPTPDVGYVLRTIAFYTDDKMMILTEVRLYANNSTPMYHVVVGDVTGKDNVAAVSAKLGDVETRVLTPSHASSDDSPHWMPRMWPLPFWMNS